MIYFLVTRRNGAFGVSIPELLKAKQWREVKRERRFRGTLLITVRLEYSSSSVFYTGSHVFNSGSELCKIILNNYSNFNVYRYGLDRNKNLIELDIVKPR